MKKLSLKLEELCVESFQTGEERPQRGTVEARARYTDPQACAPSENWNCSVGDGCTWAAYTCAWTCEVECQTDNDWSCGASCP